MSAWDLIKALAQYGPNFAVAVEIDGTLHPVKATGHTGNVVVLVPDRDEVVTPG